MAEVMIAACGGAAVAGLFGLVYRLMDKRASARRKLTGGEAGVRILLYDRIKFLAKKYINAGKVSADELEDLLSMHRIYHDELAGNGYLDSLMDAVKKLVS